MKYSIIFVLAILTYFSSALDNKPAPVKQTGTIEIIVDNLNSNDGYLRAQIFNSATASYFPDKSDKCYKFSLVKISNNRARIIFSDLPYGKYAITIHHDANSNKKLDKNWLGMPAEGWGLSTDVIPVFSLPSFDDCSFDLNQDYLKYKVLIRYLP